MSIEDAIRAYDNGDLDDETITAHAYRLNGALGRYLYATDPEERVDGTMALKGACEAVLEKRRAEYENSHGPHRGAMANFGGDR